MKKLILLLSFLIFNISISYSQDWVNLLKKDLVKIESGKFKSVDYTLLSFPNGSSLQIQSYAEAPADGTISRDNFVSVFAVVQAELINSMTSEAGINEDNFKTKTIDELIGNPDIIINCYMTKAGIQIEFKTEGGGTNRITQRWEDMFQ